jgi:hypothetical protein
MAEHQARRRSGATVKHMLVGTANVSRDDLQDHGMINLATLWILEFGISDVVHLDNAWLYVDDTAIFAHGTPAGWPNMGKMRATKLCAAGRRIHV